MTYQLQTDPSGGNARYRKVYVVYLLMWPKIDQHPGRTWVRSRRV